MSNLQSKTRADGRMWMEEPVVLVGSAARTTTANGSPFEMGGLSNLRVDLDVTAASGTTPTLDVTVQTSKDGATWRTLGTFAQKTAISSERKSFGGCDRFTRVIWTIGGTTPSFTFSISGEAL